MPLFAIVPIDWAAPDPADFDAVLMTSANAARHGGAMIGRYTRLPLYTVGEATAATARQAGFAMIAAAYGNATSAADLLRAEGRRRVLHFAGREVRSFDETGLGVTRIAVYATEPLTPDGLAAAAEGAIVLLHSARASHRFAELIGSQRGSVRIAAISETVTEAVGQGWQAIAVAARPTEDAMFAAVEVLAGPN